jgi:hypothetical protein
MNLSDIEGAWILIKPIQAEMQLARSGNAVSGTYHNSVVEGTIEGTLTTEGEANILTGKWRDQLGAGDFRVAFTTPPESEGRPNRIRCVFYGKWKHSKSRDWNGVFEGEKKN